jgi:caffeoyl-CoA O-methyltransferase
VLGRLREETASNPQAGMQISPDQGQFFQFLIRATRARKCLEIGVFTGYSAASVALALPSEGRLVACDVSEEWTNVARRYWRESGVDQKVDLRLGPALETLDSMIANGESGSFDFAFIDADKPNYWNYWERVLTLLRPGGVVAVDNVLWHARVFDAAVQDETTRIMREFNRKVYEDPRVFMFLLPMRDGITLACKHP